MRIAKQNPTIERISKRFSIYSQTPQYRRSWDRTGKKGPKSGGIPKTAVYIGNHIIYNLQNPYLGLGIGRRYWEGGGIGRGGIQGDDCIPQAINSFNQELFYKHRF